MASDPVHDQPIVAPNSVSPARASRPDTELEEHYHTYQSNPAPWWLTALWASFLLWGLGYLVFNLI